MDVIVFAYELKPFANTSAVGRQTLPRASKVSYPSILLDEFIEATVFDVVPFSRKVKSYAQEPLP